MEAIANTVNALDQRTHTAKRDDNGYPLLEDGTIDWELAGHEKEKIRKKYEQDADLFKKIKNTNRTPPKKKRK